MSRTLSSREKILAMMVGAIVLIGGTYMLFDSYISKRSSLTSKIVSSRKQLRSVRELLGQSALWEQREQWLELKQPRMQNADTAGVQLLDAVREIARRHEVLLENPTIRTPDHRPDCTSVALEIETKSAWPPLVKFLEELQTPDQFVALESANLKIDPSEATHVHGRFKIARWYAPN